MSSMTAWFSTATLILWLLPLPLLTAEFIRTGSRWRLVQAGTLLGLALLEILGQATGARWGTKAYDLVDFTAQGIGLLAIAHSLAESSLIRSSALRTTRALTIAMAVAAPVVVLLKKVGWEEIAVPVWSLGIALMMSLTAVARLDAPQRILRLLTSLAFLASMDSTGARPLYAVFLASTLAWSAIRSISESDSVRRRLARQRAFPKIFEKSEESSPEAADVLVEDTLAPILESAQQGASAEGGAVFLYREETDPAVGTTSRGLACVHAAGALSSLRGAGRAQSSRLLAQGLLARLTEGGQAALSMRVEEELDLTRDLRVTYLAAAEIRSKDRALGLLVLGCRGERGFQAQDLSLLEVLAAQAAFGLLHQRVYQKVLGQSRFSRELEIAARIQRGLLPREMPKAVNIEIAATMQPAREIGGDYFDLIPISDDRLVVVIGDVSGKGLPAGMIMLIVRTILHLLVETQSSPSWLVSSLNARLAPQLDSRTFITLLCLRWNGRERQLSWTGAGHEHMLWWSEREGFLRRIRGGGVALGLRENISGFISESRLDLNVGDVVLLYTDGVTEARDPQGEEFGIEALEESLRRLHQEAPEAILAGILNDVERHAAGTPPGDDRTLLVLKVL